MLKPKYGMFKIELFSLKKLQKLPNAGAEPGRITPCRAERRTPFLRRLEVRPSDSHIRHSACKFFSLHLPK